MSQSGDFIVWNLATFSCWAFAKITQPFVYPNHLYIRWLLIWIDIVWKNTQTKNEWDFWRFQFNKMYRKGTRVRNICNSLLIGNLMRITFATVTYHVLLKDMEFLFLFTKGHLDRICDGFKWSYQIYTMNYSWKSFRDWVMFIEKGVTSEQIVRWKKLVCLYL